MKQSKQGQAEHIFSDLIPGAAIIIISYLILSIAHIDVYDGLDKQLHERDMHARTQRNMITYLGTTATIQKEPSQIWQLIANGQPSTVDPRNVPGMEYGNYKEDYSTIETTASTIFQPLFNHDAWQLIITYPDYETQIHHQPNYAHLCQVNLEGTPDTITINLPGKQPTSITLHYCITHET